MDRNPHITTGACLYQGRKCFEYLVTFTVYKWLVSVSPHMLTLDTIYGISFPLYLVS